MVEEGVLSKHPPVQAAFGFHQWPFLPLGVIGARPGTLMAASELFDITVHGRGGHAAMPHLVIDPIVTAAQVMLSLSKPPCRHHRPLPLLSTACRQQGLPRGSLMVSRTSSCRHHERRRILF